MKTLTIATIILLHSTVTSGATLKRPAVIRDDHFNAKIETVVLEDLLETDKYEGKYFKIVHAKNDEAISTNASKELQLKAATAYFHLTKARRFFIKEVKSAYVESMNQVTIRIDLTNVFNELGHFANDNLTPQYNNALAIPAGDGFPSRGVLPWGSEIWFRPAKEININDYPELAAQSNLKDSLKKFRNQSHMDNLENFFSQMFAGGADPGNIMRVAGSSLMIEAIYQSSDIAAEFFARKIYRLDSALVPEIIYHEFSHIALSEHLELSHSTPVNEGLADYFAGKIANSKKLATKIKEYNLYNGKEVQKKQQYQLAYERGELANTDFVFGLLWNIGQVVGNNELAFMEVLSGKLTTNSSIKDDLIEASLETCSLKCSDPTVDKLKLYRMFDRKNL